MMYDRICLGRFLNRPNRFAAQVELGGVMETWHIKNTGRCRFLSCCEKKKRIFV